MNRRMPIHFILLLCILFGFYSIICGQIPYSSDRKNYAFRFTNAYDIREASVGLYWLEEFLRLFSNDAEFFFFSAAFIYLLITLMAYRLMPETTPLSLLLLGLSNYCFYGFYLYKQCFAIALIAVSFAAFMRRKTLLCVLTLILAMTFHESAYVMGFLFIVLIGSKKRFVRIAEYVIVLLLLLFFRQITSFFTNILVRIIPSLADQVEGYVGEDGGFNVETNYLTAIKGFPYYVITFFAFLKRSELKDRIMHYDRFLVMSVFTSGCVLASTFMFWMWRFGAYCYFPMLVFASLIYKHMRIQEEKRLFGFLVLCSLAFFTFRALSQYYFIHGGF